MKKILLFFILILFCFVGNTFSETRIQPTITAYTSNQLVKRGDAKVYSATFVSTAANGFFCLLDALTNTNSGTTVTDMKAEGSEATSANSKFYDFSNKPIEFSTGLYIVVSNGFLTLKYE